MYFCNLVVAILWLVAGAQAQTPPQIKLPWGTWKAEPTTPQDVFWHISNVRFGRNTNETRFSASTFPSPISNPNTVMKITGPKACIQINTTLGSPDHSPAIPLLPNDLPGEEDCLFLDIYVPKSINVNLPTTQVIVWIYGGAFVFGSKNWGVDTYDAPFYTGRGLLEAIDKLKLSKQVIFVAGNYRLGAFGWLAGPTMQQYGQTNAGLTDQNLLFQWVQQYIGQVGGDKNSVSAWGESAGAGSIMHHLVAQDSKSLLFKNALVQSPAYEWQWDNSTNGLMQNNFNAFVNATGCYRPNDRDKFTCIQQANVQNLTYASKFVYDSFATRYLYPWGPAVDLTYPYLPPVALYYDHQKPINRLVVSHVFNESGTFTPPHTVTDFNYTSYVRSFIPQAYNSAITQAIIGQFPSYLWRTQFDRLAATVANVSFVCNNRFLYNRYRNGYKIPVWAMQYSVGSQYNPQTYDLARHASDLIPTFWNSEWDVTEFIETTFPKAKDNATLIASLISQAAAQYQGYLASYAAFGDPGTSGGVPWFIAQNNTVNMTNVLNFWQGVPIFDTTNNQYQDPQNGYGACDFWRRQALALQTNTPGWGQFSKLEDTNLVSDDQKLKVQPANAIRFELA